MAEFANEPFADFSQAARRRQFAEAIARVRAELGGDHPLLIAGRPVQTGRWIVSENPAHPAQCVGRAAAACAEHVEEAVQVALEAQARWAAVPVIERTARLRRAAQCIRERRDGLAALEVFEVGKPWREADADVVEAIDYLEYYSARMEELAAGCPLPQRPGESNQYRYVPRGVCAVIAPWNFPLGILTGMASAALAAGNVVILKPAEQSPVIAAALARLLHEAGLPAGAVQYLPGLGDEVGGALARHPSVRLIMFTGSRAVGCELLKSAGEVAVGQRFIKHVVVEMGGKNAILVDEDADLDEAVKGITLSAFGYQGQKCSAASRVIIHEAVYDRLVDRLSAAANDLVVGDPTEPRCDLGPLIDGEAHARVLSSIEEGVRSARCRYRYPAPRLPSEGYFVGPALFEGVDPHDRLAQEELFGPVVCLFRARSFEEAIRLANDVDYGLTGGVYSRSPSHLRQALEAFDVGNLYLNRPIVGSIVGRQPFGGHKLSGLGTKAGGPDYLLQLVVPKTICENTARHGIPLE